MRAATLATLFTAFGALAATPALADPCKAISDEGVMPAWLRPTDRFSGTVRYVGDGDSLCVGRSGDPARWIEVRLSDFNAPELFEPGGDRARAALSRLAMGRVVECRGRSRTFDRIAALCRLDGVPLGTLLRAAGWPEGGRGRVIRRSDPAGPRRQRPDR